MPADNDAYIDLDIKLYVRGKLFSASGNEVDFTDLKAVTKNFLNSLFCQCDVTLNGITIAQASEHYHRSYLETLMTYGTDAVATYLSKVYWYHDTGAMQHSDPSAKTTTATTNRGFITR